MVIDCETSASTHSSVLVKTAADRRALPQTNLPARTRAAAALAAIDSPKPTSALSKSSRRVAGMMRLILGNIQNFYDLKREE